MNGIVKWFNEEKGYGFLTSDDKKEFFFHYTGIFGGKDVGLEKGMPVTFDIEQTQRGYQGTNIKKYEKDTGTKKTIKKTRLADI